MIWLNLSLWFVPEVIAMNKSLDIPKASKVKQASALLAALLEHGALTTITIREHLGVMHPAGRINSLRSAGHLIDTSIVWDTDSSGTRHKQACYSLMKVTSHG